MPNIWTMANEGVCDFRLSFFFLEIIIVSVHALGTNQCGPLQYYDTVVQRCSPCEDICKNAEAQGTVRQCQQECPTFQEKPDITDKSDSGTEPIIKVGLPLLFIFIILAILVVIGFIKRKWVREKFYEYVRNQTEENNDDEAELKAIFEARPRDQADETYDTRRLQSLEMVPETNQHNSSQEAYAIK